MAEKRLTNLMELVHAQESGGDTSYRNHSAAGGSSSEPIVL